MSSWIHVADLSQLPEQALRRVDANGAPVVLIRDGSVLRALGGQCPHAGAPLEDGALCNGKLVCPWHKGTFAIEDGRVLEPPALLSLPVYPVRLDGDRVMVGVEPEARVARPGIGRGSKLAIIGGGAAGASAVATLSEAGFAGDATLFVDEPELPYDRTALSKFVPSGEMAAKDVPPLLPDGCYGSHGLHVERAHVTRLDVRSRQLSFADGREASFDAILVASGGEPRRPDIPGAGRAHLLRTPRDAAAIAAALSPGDHAAILGNSFIGLEIAAALRKRGVNVTVIAPGALPLVGPLGARVGALFRDLHEANGVRFVQGIAAGIDGDAGDLAVALGDVTRIHAQAVIAGMGVRPATAFVDGVALEHDGGIGVDAAMRAADGVYAAGDIASFPIPGTDQRGRVEHWRVAQQQGRVAALNMIGETTRYDAVPFFWTYHYGKRFDYVGHAREWDELIVDGSIDSARFVALYARFGHIKAVLASGCEHATAVLVERLREPLETDDARRLLAL